MTIKRAEWVDVRFDHIKGILLPTDVEDIRRAVKFLVNRWQFGDFRIDTFFDSLADRDRFYYSTAVKVSALLGLQEMDLNFEKIIKVKRFLEKMLLFLKKLCLCDKIVKILPKKYAFVLG